MISQFSNTGISLILDKSAFQSFNFEELLQLSKYYKVNIPPVLIWEILGDLVKDYNIGNLNRSEVISLAKKLSLNPFNSSINTHYIDLIEKELLGELNIPFYNSMVSNVELVEMPNGKRAHKFYQPDIELAIERWKIGNFTETDVELSKQWRETSTQKEILKNVKEYFKENYPELKKLRTQKNILEQFDKLLDNHNLDTEILQLFIEEFSVPADIANQIFYRWETTVNKSIKTFAPYTLHCLRTRFLFYICLQNEIIGSNPTNWVDLNYIYYLPLCRVFVSNDKLHHRLAPFLATKYQRYITFSEMKEDLKKIIEKKASLTERDLKRAEDEPPRFPELLSYKLWNEMLVGWPPKVDRELSEEEFRMINEMITQFRNAKPIK